MMFLTEMATEELERRMNAQNTNNDDGETTEVRGDGDCKLPGLHNDE